MLTKVEIPIISKQTVFFPFKIFPNMKHPQLIENTEIFAKKHLKNAEGGHDWFHVQRVLQLSKKIAKHETADILVVELAALLHDIADSKFHHGDETIGPKIAREFLQSQQVDRVTVNHVINIIENISFKGGREVATFSSVELEIVQDADRLDAMGAIGIARTFNYGGYKGRLLYDPTIAPKLHQSKEAYKASTAPTINHFYEKLLLLKDRMNTATGKKLATDRHRFMEQFLQRFFDEWNLED